MSGQFSKASKCYRGMHRKITNHMNNCCPNNPLLSASIQPCCSHASHTWLSSCSRMALHAHMLHNVKPHLPIIVCQQANQHICAATSQRVKHCPHLNQKLKPSGSYIYHRTSTIKLTLCGLRATHCTVTHHNYKVNEIETPCLSLLLSAQFLKISVQWTLATYHVVSCSC